MTNVGIVASILLASVALGAAHHQETTHRAHPTTLVAYLTTQGQRHTRTLRHRKAALIYKVTATVYQAVPGQTDDEPFVTADNSRIKPHYGSKVRWMALSNDLLARWGGQFNYGDKVRVRGISPQLDGLYTVHDTMHRRYRHCIDILTHPSEKLTICTPDVKLQLVLAAAHPAPLEPVTTLPQRAQAEPVAHAGHRGKSESPAGAPKGASRAPAIVCTPSQKGGLFRQRHLVDAERLAGLPYPLVPVGGFVDGRRGEVDTFAVGVPAKGIGPLQAGFLH